MDIIERIEYRLNETDKALLASAIAEIRQLRHDKTRRGRLIQDIFNCDEVESLPAELRKRMGEELMWA